MSHTAIRFAFDHVRTHKLKASSSLVLLCLANRHNQETGRCDPSLSRLVDDSGLSERAVRSALRDLEAQRLITTTHRTQRTGLGKKNLTNRYRIKGGAKSAGGMGQNLPPKQEYRPSAFDDLVMSLEGADYDL